MKLLHAPYLAGGRSRKAEGWCVALHHAHTQGKPCLGLCLGAQMMAKHMGAGVWAHPEGRAEIGYYPLVPTQAGEALSTDWGVPWPSHVYHWHREGFDCPAGAETLATGEHLPPTDRNVGYKAHSRVDPETDVISSSGLRPLRTRVTVVPGSSPPLS